MSREVDPQNMTADDVEYVRQRPSLRREFIMLGHGDPLDPEYPGLVDSESEPTETEEAREAREQAEREQAEAEQAVAAAKQAEVEAQAAAAEEGGSGTDDENKAEDTALASLDELPAEKQWNPSMKKGELEAVINARNAGYDDDEQISVEGTGDNGKVLKEDLVTALEQDDKELLGEE